MVLIVDDEPANRRLLAALVTDLGYEPRVAAGGEEALELLGHTSVDLVLLDLMMMPHPDGMAVLAELQRRGTVPATPVVVVTASDERKLRIDALSAGAVDFLTKPMDAVEVSCRIRALIELKQLRERALANVEGRLRESDHLLRRHFEQSPVAKIGWDPDFRVVDWNPAAEKLFGYSCAEALGQHGAFLLPDARKGEADAVWKDLLAGRMPDALNEAAGRGGKRVHAEWHNAPLTSAGGAFLGVSSVILDVSERRRLQGLLVHSQKMDAMGQLAGGIAHDFNNILAVILSYSSFILDEMAGDDEHRDDLAEVLKAAERAAGLTRQLLTFTRQQPTEKRPIDLNQSLAEIHKLLARTLGEHVALTLTPAPQAAVVRLDPVQFDQVVVNLAVNARDAMPDGGDLRISLSVVGDSVRLTVTDTGTGMDEATQQRLFEPFFTTKERGKGTGLGLATCFGIVADAGGTIDVQSALGRGTTITVALPLFEGGLGSTAVASGPAARGRGELVLLAEDDEAVRRVATRALEGAGYRVEVAGDGDEAIAKLDALGPRLDLLLSDLVMPGRGGAEVVAHARKAAPQAVILMTSGFIEESARRHLPPGLPLLWKPLRPAELIRAVGESLSTRPPPKVRTAFVIDDEELTRKVLVRVLKSGGFVVETAASVAEARTRLEMGHAPDVVLCDLELSDGSSAPLLDWIEAARPALFPRVLVLTGGALDRAGTKVVNDRRYRVLMKPITPGRLLQVLSELDAPAR